MAERLTEEDLALLDELGVAPEAEAGGPSARDERILAGFEEIARFVEQHGRLPGQGPEADIFERLYAVRLARLRALEDCRALIAPSDALGLLTGGGDAASRLDALSDDALMAELMQGVAPQEDITRLRHVRAAAEKKAPEQIADRKRCSDFDRFGPLFAKVQQDLATGLRHTRPFVRDAGVSKAEIEAGQFFILGGQTAYVAEVGESFRAPNGESDARLRVVFSNGTESNLLLRSLQRALYKDEAGRRITEPVAGPLFADAADEGDAASGTVYVVRSRSDHPLVAAHRAVLHKIGVTGGDVARRLAAARQDPTFLLAEVDVVATYELFNVNRTRLEGIIHRVFAAARLDIEIKDRFGQPVVPREWFLVPLFVIDEVIDRIRDGSITEWTYDPAAAALVRVERG